MAKKLLSGDGWSFEPAGGAREEGVVSLPPDRQKARVTLEKRAKGREMTVVSGFVLADADRKALAAALRKACGAGGGEAAGVIEIQGDHRRKIAALLADRGWTVK